MVAGARGAASLLAIILNHYPTGPNWTEGFFARSV